LTKFVELFELVVLGNKDLGQLAEYGNSGPPPASEAAIKAVPRKKIDKSVGKLSPHSYINSATATSTMSITAILNDANEADRQDILSGDLRDQNTNDSDDEVGDDEVGLEDTSDE
jgi:hypothetical protein